MPENLMRSQVAGRAATAEGMRGRTGNPVGMPRDGVSRPDAPHTPPATDAGGGFRYGHQFYSQTEARRQQPVVDASTPTSLRWVGNDPALALRSLQDRPVVRYRRGDGSPGGLVRRDGSATSDPSEVMHREAVRRPEHTLQLEGEDAEVHGPRLALEATKAGRGAFMHEIIELAQRHRALGVDARTAVDHVMGHDHDGVSYDHAMRRGASGSVGTFDSALAEQHTRGNPVNPNKAAAKKVVLGEIARIDEARARAREYQEALAAKERARLAGPETLDREAVNDLVDSAIEQANSAAILKKLLEIKPQSEKGLSWFDAGSGDLAQKIKTHHGIEPVTLKDDETAEFVTGEITSEEPENADRAFVGLMKHLNPNGGVMLARVPLSVTGRLQETMMFPDTVPGADPAPGTTTKLDGLTQIIPDGSHAYVVVRTSVKQLVGQH